ncbi:Tim44/TimA family putative adaptor protein [Parasphingopyxis marina]|uniref:Tim44 domain-containing protein n=1 Tax=Parasphingopyxis marina TaxID=2761622 RepID=A0A842HYW9_9SPHN|nr:Tim44/TimA family putative adaptor protein [Parasphingopyxis marina]MBC2777541.1 Tim44 domain-containing protein [Parasphingopyxis marina]
MSPEIILLALVALFVGLRLFSVLGQRTGHEQEHRLPPQPAEPRPTLTPVPQPVPDAVPEAASDNDGLVSPAALSGVRKIAAADSTFDVNSFLIGAQAAYKMTLEAFWKGDRDDLRHLVSDEVFESFDAAIAAREEQEHVLDNRLVAIERTQIDRAEYSSHIARIRLRFDADIAAVTRDKDGNVVAGSLSDAVPTHDVWTFERNVRESDPNWILVETDEGS